jgi:hypothetical protein
MLNRTSSTSSGKDDVSRQACQECAVALRDQLLFVVLPKKFLEETAIRDAIINVWNCDPVMYATFRGDAPASYYAVVREKVRERFAEATRL